MFIMFLGTFENVAHRHPNPVNRALINAHIFQIQCILFCYGQAALTSVVKKQQQQQNLKTTVLQSLAEAKKLQQGTTMNIMSPSQSILPTNDVSLQLWQANLVIGLAKIKTGKSLDT